MKNKIQMIILLLLAVTLFFAGCGSSGPSGGGGVQDPTSPINPVEPENPTVITNPLPIVSPDEANVRITVKKPGYSVDYPVVYPPEQVVTLGNQVYIDLVISNPENESNPYFEAFPINSNSKDFYLRLPEGHEYTITAYAYRILVGIWEGETSYTKVAPLGGQISIKPHAPEVGERVDQALDLDKFSCAVRTPDESFSGGQESIIWGEMTSPIALPVVNEYKQLYCVRSYFKGNFESGITKILQLTGDWDKENWDDSFPAGEMRSCWFRFEAPFENCDVKYELLTVTIEEVYGWIINQYCFSPKEPASFAVSATEAGGMEFEIN